MSFRPSTPGTAVSVSITVTIQRRILRPHSAQKWDLGLRGGMVIGNPIPEQYEMDPKVIDGAINRALNEADARGIKGKETTPFLLDRVKQLTGGDSLESNIELVYNNARVGTEIAVELAKLS